MMDVVAVAVVFAAAVVVETVVAAVVVAVGPTAAVAAVANFDEIVSPSAAVDGVVVSSLVGFAQRGMTMWRCSRRRSCHRCSPHHRRCRCCWGCYS